MKKLLILPVFFLVGCATLSPAGRTVKIVDPAELAEVKKCPALGEVSGSAEGEGSTGESLALIELKNNAGAIGATVVVSKIRSQQSYGWFAPKHTINGQAFKCSAEATAKLMNAESL